MPATSALVMRTVAPQRSGMASATMNALRQTGMTLGIALLGTLMSMQAVTTLTAALHTQGVEQAAEIARVAVIEQQQTAVDAVGANRLQDLTHSAFADGFGIAMFWAGLLSIAMTVWLLIMLHPRFRLHSQAENALLSKSAERLNEE